MALYTFRCINRRNRILWERDMDCSDDLHALDIGNDLDCADDVEITTEGRRVARIPRRGGWAASGAGPLSHAATAESAGSKST